MRVVGYIREASGVGEPAFAQSEQIRRWVQENGHRLVALCQDVRAQGHSVGREGLQSIIGIVSAGQVDAVVVPALETFAADKISQEVIMTTLLDSGVKLLSTRIDDIDQLTNPPADPIRLLVRDVLAKQSHFAELLALPVAEEDEPEVIRVDEAPNVVIELIPPEKLETLPREAAQPAR